MNFPINPGMYNEGAVQFNALPFVNHFLQVRAKKEAKEAALNDYFNDQEKAVTPTGMRAKDIESGWSQRVNDWQKLGMEKRKFLLNPALDNHQTLNEFNRRKNELLADINKSKEQAANEAKFFEAKKSGWNFTEDDDDIIQDLSRSIYDPQKKWRTVNEMSTNRPKFDPNKFLGSVQSGMKRGVVEDTPVVDANKGLQTINYREEFRPSEIRAMADKAPFLIEADRSAKDEFERMLSSDMLPQLQEAYQKVYPDGGIVDTPAKAAQAFTILNTSQPTGFSTKTQKYVDPNKSLNDQLRLIAAREASAKRINAAKAAKTTNEAKTVMNESLNDLISAGKKGYYVIGDKSEDVLDLPVTDDAAKAAMLPGETRAPNQLQLFKKGDKEYIRRVYYKPIRDDKGFIVGYEKKKNGAFKVDSTKTREFPIKQFRDQWAKNLFSGKILHSEQGAEVDIDDVDFDDDGVDVESLRTTYQY